MNAKIPILHGFKALFVLAVGACTYSQPTAGEPPEETSGGGGMNGASSASSNSSTSSGMGLASGTSTSSSSSSGGTSSSSSSSSGEPGSSSSSNSGSSSSSGVPATEIVHCGPNNTMCKVNIALGDGCCYHNGTYTCGDVNNCAGYRFFCDGAEDCPDGFVCCLNPISQVATCTGAAACSGTLITVCNDTMDCPKSMDCDPMSYGTIGKCAN